jgi:molecular chaperone GrpE
MTKPDKSQKPNAADVGTPPSPDARIEELETQLKRVAADFDNFRKRTEHEKRESFQLAQATTLLELTPVLDNFRRATEHLPEDLKDNHWVTGVLYIEKQLEQIFHDLGVEKIKTVGELFNPQLHEAVSHEPHSSVEAHHIFAEVESGYTCNSTTLKPAKVKVSSGPATP